MARLHYENRKVDGEKLVGVIVRDLNKRLPGKCGYKAAIRDPSMDINISNKRLDNDDIEIILMTARNVLQWPDSTRMEEFCLSGMSISVQNLGDLGRLVSLAGRELKDLDLSNNSISVVTKGDAIMWEAFLRCFVQATALRRLDLSGNPLGSLGFEILVRVYASEWPISTYFAQGGNYKDAIAKMEEEESLNHKIQDILLQSTEQESNAGAYPLRRCLKIPDLRKWIDFNSQSEERPPKPALKLKTFNKADWNQLGGSLNAPFDTKDGNPTSANTSTLTRGLRSIPYIILTNTSMTDICALNLSYILEAHCFPENLMRVRQPPKRGSIWEQQIKSYDRDLSCRGIVYSHGDGLSPIATRVLGLAESARFERQVEKVELHKFDEEIMVGARVRPPSRRPSLSTPPGFAIDRHRPVSILGPLTGRPKSSTSKLLYCDESNGEIGADMLSELERVRSKIQISIIRENGIHAVELWSTAMRYLRLTRILMLDARKKQEDEKAAEIKLSDLLEKCWDLTHFAEKGVRQEAIIRNAILEKYRSGEYPEPNSDSSCGENCEENCEIPPELGMDDGNEEVCGEECEETFEIPASEMEHAMTSVHRRPQPLLGLNTPNTISSGSQAPLPSPPFQNSNSRQGDVSQDSDLFAPGETLNDENLAPSPFMDMDIYSLDEMELDGGPILQQRPPAAGLSTHAEYTQAPPSPHPPPVEFNQSDLDLEDNQSAHIPGTAQLTRVGFTSHAPPPLQSSEFTGPSTPVEPTTNSRRRLPSEFPVPRAIPKDSGGTHPKPFPYWKFKFEKEMSDPHSCFQLQHGLPFHAMVDIISLTIDEKEILNEDQKHLILEFAMHRETLMEREVDKGKTYEVKIWRLLDALESLRYLVTF